MIKQYYGQWYLSADSHSYRFTNHDEYGTRLFYMVEPGKYGQPVIIAEPDLGFDAPDGTYVNAKGVKVEPNEKIAGIICKDGPRFSLSNAKKQGIQVKPNDDGSIQVGDEVWWIATLFSKDKNRIVGYDAYLVREKPDSIRVLELGDLDLF